MLFAASGSFIYSLCADFYDPRPLGMVSLENLIKELIWPT